MIEFNEFVRRGKKRWRFFVKDKADLGHDGEPKSLAQSSTSWGTVEEAQATFERMAEIIKQQTGPITASDVEIARARQRGYNAGLIDGRIAGTGWATACIAATAGLAVLCYYFLV